MIYILVFPFVPPPRMQKNCGGAMYKSDVRKKRLASDPMGTSIVRPIMQTTMLSAKSWSASMTMILLLTVLNDFSFCKAQKDEGSECVVDRSAGICKKLNDCPSVYAELLKGNPPQSACGYQNFEPIVCCPATTDIITTSKPNTVTRDNVNEVGVKAKAKCQEYASYVYTLERPPILGVDPTYVNVSTCAIVTKKLIVGGKKAEPKEFPHMAAIGFTNSEGGIEWQCGGSLISERFVLTAAHCTWNLNTGKATWVRVGDLNLVKDNDDASPQNVRIVNRIRHPNYKAPSKYHDIALLELEEDVTLNKWVRPVCLPYSSPDIGSNKRATATGWGHVEWAGEQSNHLMKVVINLIPHETCNDTFSRGGPSNGLTLGIVEDRQICAGEPGKDTCQGDSGGPLVVRNEDVYCMYNLIGVTSLGKLCGSNSPGIYTRVSNYLQWIEDTVWP